MKLNAGLKDIRKKKEIPCIIIRLNSVSGSVSEMSLGKFLYLTGISTGDSTSSLVLGTIKDLRLESSGSSSVSISIINENGEELREILNFNSKIILDVTSNSIVTPSISEYSSITIEKSNGSSINLNYEGISTITIDITEKSTVSKTGSKEIFNFVSKITTNLYNNSEIKKAIDNSSSITINKEGSSSITIEKELNSKVITSVTIKTKINE